MTHSDPCIGVDFAPASGDPDGVEGTAYAARSLRTTSNTSMREDSSKSLMMGLCALKGGIRPSESVGGGLKCGLI
jgi:hypothetical protein